MKIVRFEWDAWNVEHIARHGVKPDEAEDVLWNGPLVRQGRSGTRVALGQTEAGRLLAVVFAVRSGHAVYVVTARDMDHKERRLYRRERRR